MSGPLLLMLNLFLQSIVVLVLLIRTRNSCDLTLGLGVNGQNLNPERCYRTARALEEMMRKWLPGSFARVHFHRPLLGARYLGAVAFGLHDMQRVSVRCGSSGDIFLDLHNLVNLTSSDPLLVYLPPFSTLDSEQRHELPSFIQRYPTVVINYRWAGYSPFQDDYVPSSPPSPDEDGTFSSPLNWPMPITDTLLAYNWIVKHLTPPISKKRDIYVYGSYLGASLATSLALTENHPHQTMGVRGFVAFSGIYNWTMFLPDHQVNSISKHRSNNILQEILGHPTDPAFQELKRHAASLFREPRNLFDPFASPCLFFHTPGLLVPENFNSSANPIRYTRELKSAAIDARDPIDIRTEEMTMTTTEWSPRRSPLDFPPRKSTLKLPDGLLLHTTSPQPPVLFQKAGRRKKREEINNHFQLQAEELAKLMRKSLRKLELKTRLKWDYEFDEYNEIRRRIQVYNVGSDEKFETYGLPRRAENLVIDWLDDRMSR